MAWYDRKTAPGYYGGPAFNSQNINPGGNAMPGQANANFSGSPEPLTPIVGGGQPNKPYYDPQYRDRKPVEPLTPIGGGSGGSGGYPEPLTPIGGGSGGNGPGPLMPIIGGGSGEPMTPIGGGTRSPEPLSPITGGYPEPLTPLSGASNVPPSLAALSRRR